MFKKSQDKIVFMRMFHIYRYLHKHVKEHLQSPRTVVLSADNSHNLNKLHHRRIAYM